MAQEGVWCAALAAQITNITFASRQRRSSVPALTSSHIWLSHIVIAGCSNHSWFMITIQYSNKHAMPFVHTINNHRVGFIQIRITTRRKLHSSITRQLIFTEKKRKTKWWINEINMHTHTIVPMRLFFVVAIYTARTNWGQLLKNILLNQMSVRGKQICRVIH